MSETVVGIIGGTGMYQLENLANVTEYAVDTPYGTPSSLIVEGTLNGVRVLFMIVGGIIVQMLMWPIFFVF